MGKETGWAPGRWWRVVRPDGSLWCETSDEEEARERMRPGDTLSRLWSRTEQEWRQEVIAEGIQGSEPVQTGMRLSNTKTGMATGHLIDNQLKCDHDIPRASIEVRIIGWIDQRGRVWLSDQDWMRAGGPGGSVTPMFIAPGCD